jgi:hypothetical protein
MEEAQTFGVFETVHPTWVEERSPFVIRNTFIECVFDGENDDDLDGEFLEWPVLSDPTNGGQQRVPLMVKTIDEPVPQRHHLCVDLAPCDKTETASSQSPHDDASVNTGIAEDTDPIQDNGAAAMQYPQWQAFDPSIALAATCAYNYCVPVLCPVSILVCAATPSPPCGYSHTFHREVRCMGSVSEDFRRFTKEGFEGRLSVVSESRVHDGGIHRYMVQFASGNLSKADGVGFVFSPTLPCKKNIQRIVSIFINQRGRICMRVCEDILRASARVRALKCGDWVEMVMDLDRHTVSFSVWSEQSAVSSPVAEFDFGRRLEAFYGKTCSPNIPDLSTGYFACVIKNEGVTVALGT